MDPEAVEKGEKRFASDGQERSRRNAAGLIPDWAREHRESEAAVREAERILSETEPASDAFPYVFAEGLTRMDALGVVTAHVSLAESLAAVLPVLDEMAPDAVIAANDFDAYDEWQRNRATLAAMGGR